MKTRDMSITRWSSVRVWKSSAVLFAATAGFILPLLARQVPATEKVDGAVETALLAEDWKTVANMLASVNPQTPSPVLRMIKGHACLALNQNNEAVCLFLSGSPTNQCLIWHKWAQDFVVSHSKSPIAQYLTGDAHARLNQLDAANTDFKNALGMNAGKCLKAMTFSARGVVSAARQNLSGALDDFDQALSTYSRFADAYANLGMRSIQKKDGATVALQRFERALELSPQYSLALHGRACIKMVLGKDPTEDLTNAVRYAGCASTQALFRDNTVRIAAYWRGMDKHQLIALESQPQPGTTMTVNFQKADTELHNYLNKPTQYNFNRLAEASEKLTSQQYSTFFSDKVAPALKSDSTLNSTYSKQLGEFGSWNKSVTPKIADAMKNTGAGITVGSLWTDPEPTTKAIIGTAGVGINRLGDKLGGWAETHSQFYNNATDAYSKSMGQEFKPGGVDTSFGKAVWDEGDWPFAPYYGMGYGVSLKGDLFGKKSGVK